MKNFNAGLAAIVAVLFALTSGLSAQNKWNVKDYGVKGDGVTVDRDAIQAVIQTAYLAGGGTVFFPAVDTTKGEYYRIATPPLHMRDNVVLEGEGPASLIKGSNLLFAWGTAFPQKWHDARAFNIADVDSGDTHVTLLDKTQISNFAIGKIIRMSDPRFVTYPNGVDHEVYGQLFRIMNIDAMAGKIFLSNPILLQVSSPVLHPIEDCSPDNLIGVEKGKGFGTWRGGLRKLGLESANRVHQRGGAVECFMEDLTVKGYSGVLYGNAWHFCMVKRIHEHVKFAMEMSDCSVGNQIDSIRQEFFDKDGIRNMWVGMQEYSSFNTVSHFTYILGNEPLPTGVIRTIEGRGNTWKHGTIDASRLPAGTSNLLRPQCDNSTLYDIQVICNNPSRYFICIGSGLRIEKITITDIGSDTNSEAFTIDANNSAFKDIKSNKGLFVLTNKSSNNRVINFSNPGNIKDKGLNNKIETIH